MGAGQNRDCPLAASGLNDQDLARGGHHPSTNQHPGQVFIDDNDQQQGIKRLLFRVLHFPCRFAECEQWIADRQSNRLSYRLSRHPESGLF